MRTYYLILGCLFFLISCSNKIKSDFEGVYYFKNDLIIDSLLINSDNTYNRFIMKNTPSRELIFENTEQWNFNEDNLILNKFYIRTGDAYLLEHKYDKEYFEISLITVVVGVSTNLFGVKQIEITKYNKYKKC